MQIIASTLEAEVVTSGPLEYGFDHVGWSAELMLEWSAPSSGQHPFAESRLQAASLLPMLMGP